MGLDTTHNCWHAPYSSFNEWRYSLGRQIGINLDEYIGYGDNATKDLKTIEHDLMPLFDHSDCDGVLTVEESKRIVKGLNSILNNLNKELEMPYDFKEKTIQFLDGCVDAISKNEIIEFN